MKHHVQLKLNDEEYKFLVRMVEEESQKMKVRLTQQDYLRLILLRQEERGDGG